MCFYTKKTIYLIGNGFDLHHKFPTRYKDYKEFLTVEDCGVVDSIDEILEEKGHSSEEIELWSKLEEFLGEFPDLNYEDILEDAFDSSENDMDRASYWDDPSFFAEEIPKDRVKLLLEIKKHFNDWVNSIRIDKNAKDEHIKFEKRSLFLNFNYTKTLETIYGVPPDKILYIHTQGEKYILGHNQPENLPFKTPEIQLDEYGYEDISDDDIRSSGAKEKLNSVYRAIYGAYYKNSRKLIQDNASWFSQFRDVKKIVIMGLSLGQEDEIYLDYISENAIKCEIIEIYCHSESDKERAELIAKIKFPRIKVECKEW